jgi:hypothetical protein|tara:strand:+ start:751 stop:930 length:180 start_codon:yes stop_codon:yes gene_type:complete
MAYKRGADGVAKKGKTDVKNLGTTEPKVLGKTGGRKSAGVSSESMKQMGRGLARVANQG